LPHSVTLHKSILQADAEFARRLQQEEEARLRDWPPGGGVPHFPEPPPSDLEGSWGTPTALGGRSRVGANEATTRAHNPQEALLAGFQRASELMGGAAAALEDPPPEAEAAQGGRMRTPRHSAPRGGAAERGGRGGAGTGRAVRGGAGGRGQQGGAYRGARGGGVRMRYAR
jgi:hypothetical protein